MGRARNFSPLLIREMLLGATKMDPILLWLICERLTSVFNALEKDSNFYALLAEFKELLNVKV